MGGKAESQSKFLSTKELADIEAKLDHASHGLAALKTLVDAVESKLDDPTTGLSSIKTEVTAIEGKLDDGKTGLVSIKSEVSALEGKLDDPSHGLANLKTLIDAVEGKLDHASHGLAALKSLIDAIEAKLDVPTNFMADVSALALEATLNTHDADIKTLLTNGTYGLSALETLVDEIETLLKNGTYGLSALEILVDEVETLLKDGTYGLAALNTDLDKLLTGIIQGTGTVLPANKSLYDILWLDKSTDEQGSFNWDTSAYTTVEQDISALFTTALTGTERREYQVYLALSNVEGDGNFDECYVRVYVKINGTYHCIDKATKTKANLQAEPGVPIEIPKTAEDAKVTLQMKTALAGDQTINYSYVQEKLEY